MSDPIDLEHDTHVEAAKDTETEPMESGTALDADRISAIRERYARGVYDAPAVMEEVARRLLERGVV